MTYNLWPLTFDLLLQFYPKRNRFVFKSYMNKHKQIALFTKPIKTKSFLCKPITSPSEPKEDVLEEAGWLWAAWEGVSSSWPGSRWSQWPGSSRVMAPSGTGHFPTQGLAKVWVRISARMRFMPLQAHVINEIITKFYAKLFSLEYQTSRYNAFLKPTLQGLYE